MKTIKLFVFFYVAINLIISCNFQTGNKEINNKVLRYDKIEVFYFHFARRCVTCRTVEKVSMEAIKELYVDKVSFTSYNLDMPEGEIFGKKLGVAGQTLLIVYDDKKIDLTAKGFRYARNNPEKLKKIIKEKIDPLL